MMMMMMMIICLSLLSKIQYKKDERDKSRKAGVKLIFLEINHQIFVLVC